MLRVRGSLVPVEGMPRLTPTDTREIVYAILNSSQRQRLETDWQIDFAYSIPGHARFRVNAYFQRGTIGAAFRLIPAETVPIEQLGLPPVIREFARKPRGIVLVTGPTGSGKSTTLASLINEINETRDEHIMTIEDPIEFLHRHKKCIVNQRELGGDAQSFAMALKAALRQDPDVILVGEMRDMETIGTALTAAETGHLVFATLHTQDAPQTVDRIIDVFPPAQQGQIRAQLAIGLQGIVTQTLVPTADGQGRCVAAEVLVPDAGRPQPDPRGQDAPDLLAHPDGRRARHADDGHVAGRPRPRGQDHDGDGRDALLEPRGAAQARRVRPDRRRHGDGGLMATFAFKAVDLAGMPAGRRRSTASASQAVTEELKGRGLRVMALEEKKSGLQMDISLGPKRVKAHELTVMTRQLATMISSGMTLLRTFYVLEDQIENPKLRETIAAVREDIEAGLELLRRAREAPEGLHARSTSRWCAPARPAACSRSRSTGSPTSSRRTTRCAARSSPRWPTRPSCSPSRCCVLLGLIAFIVPVFVNVFKDFGGELPMITKITVQRVEVRHGPVVHPDRRRGRQRRRLQEVEGVVVGPPAVGPVPPADPVQDRRHRPEDRPRALVAHVLRALLRRRADHAGDRGDRPDGRQHGRRPRDGGRHRVRQVRRLDRRAARATPRSSPPMVAQMIAVGEETGNLDTMLTKVADFYEDEVAAAVKALTSILEPVMIILVGGIVGFIVIAMYMPMFKVYDAIK